MFKLNHTIGVITTHSDKDDPDMDMGISIGLGENESLYVGEVDQAQWEYLSLSVKESRTKGYWLIHFVNDRGSVLTKFSTVADGDEFIELMLAFQNRLVAKHTGEVTSFQLGRKFGDAISWSAAATYHEGKWWPVIEVPISGTPPYRLQTFGYGNFTAAYSRAQEIMKDAVGEVMDFLAPHKLTPMQTEEKEEPLKRKSTHLPKPL